MFLDERPGSALPKQRQGQICTRPGSSNNARCQSAAKTTTTHRAIQMPDVDLHSMLPEVQSYSITYETGTKPCASIPGSGSFVSDRK
ncbi:predicted protein [Uncinocarpus reesii 1704]|uniref:Uncharacterized protein n=1 Tax=Uncinocarpus reesii (strain UAMH 1704) TaxID=336963 RepID=C4JD85_UNCRE|nr:uncharacterized protein UREG_00285 [Uncinocarpus reesii 1704]EEP75439.1 predicted protein [Uncinocarpus reesii 1704]